MLLAADPLPPDTRMTLVDLRGDRIDIAPPSTQLVAAFSFQPTQGRMWRYSDQYSLLLDGVADFAGNAHPPGTALTSPPPRPLPWSPRMDSNRRPGRRWPARRCCRVRAPRRSRARVAFTSRRSERQPTGPRPDHAARVANRAGSDRHRRAVRLPNREPVRQRLRGRGAVLPAQDRRAARSAARPLVPKADRSLP